MHAAGLVKHLLQNQYSPSLLADSHYHYMQHELHHCVSEPETQ